MLLSQRVLEPDHGHTHLQALATSGAALSTKAGLTKG